MKKEYANEFGAVESAHMRSKARGVVGALPPLPDDIQSQITEVTGRIVAKKMQEVGREWVGKIV